LCPLAQSIQPKHPWELDEQRVHHAREISVTRVNVGDHLRDALGETERRKGLEFFPIINAITAVGRVFRYPRAVAKDCSKRLQ
jgi:hypothetical protein